jgi:hypothetical protein
MTFDFMANQPIGQLPRVPSKHLDMERAQKKFAEFWKDPVVCPVRKTTEWVENPGAEIRLRVSPEQKRTLMQAAKSARFGIIGVVALAGIARS